MTDVPVFVVGTDFTPASQAAFDSGLRMAQEQNGRLLLVHAVRALGAPGLELTRPDTDKQENETAEPPGVLAGRDWVDLARAHGVEAETVVRPGLPATVLVEEAQRVHARAVVLGSGKDDLEKAFLGSVAADVRKATDLEVVVVPPHAVS